MSRVLTISRVTVPPEAESAYLEAVSRLAELGAARGRRLWVFRTEEDPRQFVEFNEGPARSAHRRVAELSEEERLLEDQLAHLVEYATDAWEWLDEVPLAGSPADH